MNGTRRILPVALSAGLVAALGGVAQAVTIPDGGTVEADHVGLIHFRIAEGCDGAATDGLEVTVPEELTQVVPEAVPGWAVESETVERDGSPEVSVVRWTGGPLPDGQLLEFGLRATFPDEPGLVLELPAVQHCGMTRSRRPRSDSSPPYQSHASRTLTSASSMPVRSKRAVLAPSLYGCVWATSDVSPSKFLTNAMASPARNVAVPSVDRLQGRALGSPSPTLVVTVAGPDPR